MNFGCKSVLAVAALAGAAFPAFAWGPKTQAAIVNAANQLISQEGVATLNRLTGDVQRGAMVQGRELNELIPLAAGNLEAAIEAEMYLLQAVRGERVDPYYAFRLGVLGKLVAQATAPLRDASPPLRNQYYADSDANVDGARLSPRSRRVVDPKLYFAELRRAMAEHEAIVLKEYETGQRFQGLSRSGLSDNLSRSVNAVADIWYTILTGSVVVANISEEEIRNYILSALAFYIERGNTTEVENTYTRLVSRGAATPDLRERIGDLFYSAGQRERAIEEYEALLVVDPNRRGVAEKIAQYYVDEGDERLEAGQLELAQEAYEKAVAADRLHPSAQGKLITARRMITERAERMNAADQALEKGAELENAAEQEVRRQNYAKAIDMLLQADSLYAQVTSEFAELNRKASTARTAVGLKIRQLKDDLAANSGSLSGSGASVDHRVFAKEATAELARQAVQDLITKQYFEEVNERRQELTGKITP